MDAGEVLALGLGVTPPWRLVSQHLETGKQPHELHLRLEADRGSLFACPECGRACKAHDFAEFRWRHLNFFQHHCYITARVPRTDCPDHGVKRAQVPWARDGSGFTLLFEQVALMLAREMPVQAAARQMAITDQRLWRIIGHYVGQALDRLFAPRMKALLLRAFAIARRRRHLAETTRRQYRSRLDRDLDAIMALAPENKHGKRLRKRYAKVRGSLFTFLEHPDVAPDNNGSERELRPTATYRKVTGGFRSDWGADLFAGIKSVIGTAARNGIDAYAAILSTLRGQSVLAPG